jgi:hypothetical protein
MQERMLGFDPRSVLMGYAVNKVALRLISLRELLIFPVSFIPAVQYTYISFIFRRCYTE